MSDYDRPETLEAWLERVKRHERLIFVREQAPTGVWYNAVLGDLPPDRWAYHVARWLEGGHVPVRLREEVIEERLSHE